uniref:ATP synthase subunit a n=1 Tax=Perumytilus purpuratus TaxID=390823 RepID=A0A346KKZ7_PERPP|nr:ATP synthase F0 subunit 6 [Perumytilus purpuratus]AXP84515.1 ATP synthase F0 subunit 6 [Perumytilus purpuratus]
MLMDVFSVFDDKNFSALSSVLWLASLFSLMMVLFKLFWSRKGMVFCLVNLLRFNIESNILGFNLTGFSGLMAPLFILLFWSSLSGCVPYFFPFSCHAPFSLTFSIMIWTMLVISSMLNSWDQVLASLVPSGSPMVLCPLLVVVEVISSIIRPLTLVMRFVLNLVTGQILLGLLSEMLEYNVLACNLLISLALILVVMGYLLFEFCVSFLQSYIFCVLLSMYSNDHSYWR